MTQLANNTPAIEIQLPFVGFYNTYLSERLDDDFEHIEISELNEADQAKCFELFNDGMNYRGAFEEIAIDYAKCLLDDYTKAANELGWQVTNTPACEIDVVFPSQYNFVTDSIYVKTLPEILPTLDKVEAYSNGFTQKLRQTIFEECSSRDGFYSFTPNQIDENLLTGDFLEADDRHLSIYFTMLCELLFGNNDEDIVITLQNNYLDYCGDDSFYIDLIYKHNKNADEIQEIINSHYDE